MHGKITWIHREYDQSVIDRMEVQKVKTNMHKAWISVSLSARGRLKNKSFKHNMR